MPDTPNQADPRPVFAVVCRTVPPYRRHLHHRIAREIPELRLLTFNTHEDKTRDWHVDQDEEIGLINLPMASNDKGHSGTGLSEKLLGPVRRWQQGGQIIRTLRDNPPAAVVLNGYNDPGRLRLIRWCHRNRVPSFIWGDSNVQGERLISDRKKWMKRQYIQWLARRVTGFIGCGSYGVDYWKMYGIDEQRVFMAPYEPDYSLIQDLPQSVVDQAARELNFPSERRRLFFCGRLIPVKRPDLLVDAFVRIATERPEWDLVMLGDGPLKESLVSKLSPELAKRIFWLPFTNDQQRVSAIYRACDALVLPSDYEPWALVVNEAVAAGLAVVSTDVVGAAAELVVDGDNGRLVPPGDLDALADALRDVTAPENIDRMQAASPARLADWQRRGDPVAGYRKALAYAKALSK